MRSVLHIMRWCKILVVIWSSSDVHSYPTKCSDALALTATDSGSGREEEKQTIQIFSISAFSSNSPTISFSGSSYFQKEKSDHGFSRLPDNFRIPLLKTFTAHQSSAIKIFMKADFILPQWVRWYSPYVLFSNSSPPNKITDNTRPVSSSWVQNGI